MSYSRKVLYNVARITNGWVVKVVDGKRGTETFCADWSDVETACREIALGKPCGMGEFSCADRSQCWEPCGEMGKSEQHARVAHEPGSAT